MIKISVGIRRRRHITQRLVLIRRIVLIIFLMRSRACFLEYVYTYIAWAAHKNLNSPLNVIFHFHCSSAHDTQICELKALCNEFWWIEYLFLIYGLNFLSFFFLFDIWNDYVMCVCVACIYALYKTPYFYLYMYEYIWLYIESWTFGIMFSRPPARKQLKAHRPFAPNKKKDNPPAHINIDGLSPRYMCLYYIYV